MRKVTKEQLELRLAEKYREQKRLALLMGERLGVFQALKDIDREISKLERRIEKMESPVVAG